MSNFLGSVFGSTRSTDLLSSVQMGAREGIQLYRSMNYRDRDPAGKLSVFLVLEHEDGYQDVWDPLTRTYTFRGHDSVTSGTGRRQDQRVMYDSGRLSDNGKFLKAAHAYATRERTDPLQVQVYEKIASGVWFDKGIFNLIGVNEVRDADRLVYVFAMQPANFEFLNQDRYNVERFLPAATKASVYQQADGRCVVCGIQQGLRFVPQGNEVKLLCPAHRGEVRGLLG